MSLLFRDIGNVKTAQINRFIIEYTRTEQSSDSLWLKVRNTESLAFRAAYLAGPFVLYVDVRTQDYHHQKQIFITADQPQFEPDLKTSQSFYAELSLHTIQEKYVWIVDIVSQSLFATGATTNYEIKVGTTKEILHISQSEAIGSLNPCLRVKKLDTTDLWNTPQPRRNEPVHLVVLTHGLHSNVGADLHYLKEQIDNAAKITGENIIVRGFHGNVCRTDRGVKYLGRRVALYIITKLYFEGIERISFIGHSLGGLVQVFAIAYIESHFPWFFQKVELANFITLASPLLGVVNDSPAFVKLALDFGVVGKTGQDLGLSTQNGKILLELLPTGPAQKIMKRFRRRTLYANAVNDAIVPLRASGLLFLDWKGIAQAKRVIESNKKHAKEAEVPTPDSEEGSSGENSSQIGEIPKISGSVSSDSNSNDTRISTYLNKIQGDLNNNVQSAFSYFMPQKIGTSPSTSQSSATSSDINNETILPKPSMIESAASVILQPQPSLKFITDPSSRPDSIFHDRVYYERDIPYPTGTTFDSPDLKEKYIEVLNIEERIALKYHYSKSWRKILVNLKPDAHNNIIVRRRFSSAYGWGVIDHLVKEHFIKIDYKRESEQLIREKERIGIKKNNDGDGDLANGLLFRIDEDETDNENENVKSIMKSQNEYVNYYDSSSDEYDDYDGTDLHQYSSNVNGLTYLFGMAPPGLPNLHTLTGFNKSKSRKGSKSIKRQSTTESIFEGVSVIPEFFNSLVQPNKEPQSIEHNSKSVDTTDLIHQPIASDSSTSIFTMPDYINYLKSWSASGAVSSNELALEMEEVSAGARSNNYKDDIDDVD